jgi:hypothetical protein
VSAAVAARLTVAGAVNEAPAAGAVSDTVGGWFAGAAGAAGPPTLTLEKVAVARVDVAWLVTAMPT